MAILSSESINALKEHARNRPMGALVQYINQDIFNLCETIETQRQEIEQLKAQCDTLADTVNMLAPSEIGSECIHIAALEKAREALEQIAMYDKYMSGADEVAKATIAEIDKVLGGNNETT